MMRRALVFLIFLVALFNNANATTQSMTMSNSLSISRSWTMSNTWTQTATWTMTGTMSGTMSVTNTMSNTGSLSTSLSWSMTNSQSNSWTNTGSLSISMSTSTAASASNTKPKASPSSTAEKTGTPSGTGSLSAGATPSVTPTTTKKPPCAPVVVLTGCVAAGIPDAATRLCVQVIGCPMAQKADSYNMIVSDAQGQVTQQEGLVIGPGAQLDLEITNLMPNTMYTVEVYGIHGGVEGPHTTVSRTTGDERPKQDPDKNIQNPTCSITSTATKITCTCTWSAPPAGLSSLTGGNAVAKCQYTKTNRKGKTSTKKYTTRRSIPAASTRLEIPLRANTLQCDVRLMPIYSEGFPGVRFNFKNIKPSKKGKKRN